MSASVMKGGEKTLKGWCSLNAEAVSRLWQACVASVNGVLHVVSDAFWLLRYTWKTVWLGRLHPYCKLQNGGFRRNIQTLLFALDYVVRLWTPKTSDLIGWGRWLTMFTLKKRTSLMWVQMLSFDRSDIWCPKVPLAEKEVGLTVSNAQHSPHESRSKR